MSKSYKIKVNQGNGEAKFVDIPQVSGGGQPLAVKAVPGGKYQLVDAVTGYGPENIRASRSGQDLKVFFEGRGQPDLVIEDYYKETPEGFNGLIGEAESGRFYEYIPETAAGNSSVPLLADGSNQVGMALGGAEINASGAAVGALVAAAGLNPLLLAPLALLGAGGGGGGGGSTDPSNNNAAGIKITQVTTDTGVSNSDFVTQGPVTEFSGTLSTFTGTPGDKVKLELLNKDGTPLDPVITGTVTPTQTNGAWSWKWSPVDTDANTNLPDVLKEGDYVLKATIVTAAGVAYTHATATTTQAVDIDQTPDGPNTAAGVEILTITQDSGPSDSDFYTNDQTLVLNGSYTKFTPNGDLIKLELKNEKGEVIDTHYIKPEGDITTAQNGTWAWDRTQNAALPEGKYTLLATVVDTAGNAFPGKDDQVINIDLTGGNEGSGQVSITSMSVDSGVGDAGHVSRTDFKSNDNTPEFKGKVENSTSMQWLEIRLHNEADGDDTANDVLTTIEVKAGTTEWTWAPPTPSTGLPDASYTLMAQVVDQAGNPLSDSNSKLIYTEQAVVIDTRGPVDPTDPNMGVDLSTINILGTGDTGLSLSDFITKAGQSEADLLSFGGDFSKAYKPEAGGSVWVEVIEKTTGVVQTAGYGDLTNTSWSFGTKAVLAEGNYVVKATLLDQASNRVSSIDQLLVIDRTISKVVPAAQGLEKINGVETVISFFVGTNEQGSYSFDGINKIYTGGYFDLTELRGKTFENGVEIIFADVAGNTTIVNNQAVKAPFATNATLTKAADAAHPDALPAPGHSTEQPTVIGNVGKTLQISGVTHFDMSSLYDGIDAIADRDAVNHVDLLSSAQAQTLDLSVQDVLALGVGESFLSNGTHAGKIQIRIDGADNDTVNLSNEASASEVNPWTINVDTKVTLQGITGDYYQATNLSAGLEVFIQSGVQIHIV